MNSIVSSSRSASTWSAPKPLRAAPCRSGRAPGGRRCRGCARRAPASIARGSTTRSKSHMEEHVAEGLELGDGEALAAPRAARAPRDAGQLGRPVRARSSARSMRRSQPFARASARASSGSSAPSARRGAEPLALARRALERPGQLGERAAARPPRDVLAARSARAPRARTGSPRAAGRRRSPPRARATSRRRGPRARGVEEVAVALERVGPHEPALGDRLVERAALVVREERRLDAAGAGTSPPRGRGRRRRRSGASAPLEVEHRDAAGLARPVRGAPSRARARATTASARRLAGERRPAVQVVAPTLSTPRARAGRARRRRRSAATRGRTPPGASSRRASRTASVGVAASRTRSSGGERMAEQLHRLLLDPRRIGDRAAAQPSLDEVGAAAREPREARAEEARRDAGASRRARRSGAGRGARGRTASGRAGRCPRSRTGSRARRTTVSSGAAARARRYGQTTAISSARRPGAEQVEDLLADELERAARAGRLEEANRPVERRRIGRRPGREERPLEMRERAAPAPQSAGRQLVDPPVREPASGPSAVRASEAKTGRPGSYGSDTVTSARPESASSERPLGAGEVLEPVGEDRAPVPRVELGARRSSAAWRRSSSAVPEAEPVELLAVARVEPGERPVEVARVEQRGLARPRSPCRASPRSRGSAPTPRARSATAAADDAARAAAAAARADRGRRVSPPANAIDGGRGRRTSRSSRRRAPGARSRSSRSIRSASARFGTTRNGIAVERCAIPVEEQRDLAGVRRAHDEGEPHPRGFYGRPRPLLPGGRGRAETCGC